MSTRQFVVFTVDQEEFGLDIDRIHSIEQMMEIFRIPNTPDYIEGLVNLRGKVHTVFNLRRRFGMAASAFNDSTKIVMAGTSVSVIGIIVDAVKEIVKVEDTDLEAADETLSGLTKQFVGGIAKIGTRVILLLDLEKVLAVQENRMAIR